MRLNRWATAIGMLVLLSPAVGLLESAASPRALYARGRSQHGVGARLPLEPTRTIELTTDAVTWMSLDVSPDGRTIVFATLGDLYLMPISGGHAQRISSGMALDTQPRFSPDGGRIVFSSDRSGSENLWTLEVGKTIDDSTLESTASGLRALTAGRDASYASPEWSPDGSTVVASRTDRFTWIDVMHTVWSYPSTEGPGTQLLVDDQPVYGMGAVFGPNGALYVSHRAERGNPYGHRIDRFDLATGKVTPITAPAGGAVRPAISPDGRWMVYASRHDGQTGYRLRDLNADTERWLTFPVQHDLQENDWMGTSSDHMPGYAFVPDSSAIIAAINGKPHRIDLATGTRSAIEFTADISLPIGPLIHFETPVARGPVVVRSIRWLTHSPDGSKLAFTAVHKLWVQDTGSGAVSAIAPMDELQAMPAWSHDGSTLAFVTWSDFEGGQVYRVAADGSDLRRVSRQAGFYTDPVWVPGDQEILVTRGSWQQRGANLVWERIPADGGPHTLVASASGDRPHFADRHDRFYAYDPDEGLFSQALDGSDRQTHLTVTGWRAPLGSGGPRPADAVVMGPDGDAALVLADMRLFHVPIPQTETPATLSLAELSARSELTRLDVLGVDFFEWGRRGDTATWSLGNAVFERTVGTASSAPGGSAPSERRISIELPRDRAEGTLVLRGARILTMDPTADEDPPRQWDGIIDDGAVVIVDERIAHVGRSVDVATPDGAREIDVSGTTLLPGFIDLHAHLRAARGMHRNTAWDYLNYLAHGVTTTRNAADGIDVMTYSDLVEIGAMVGPRTFSTGRAMYPDVRIGSLQDARDLMRRYRDYYGHHTIKQYLTGDRTVRQWMAIAAREFGLTPTTEGVDMKTMITQVIDGYSLEHVLPHFPLAPDVVQLLVQSGTYYDPTLVVGTGPRSIYYWWTRTDVHDDPKVRRFTPHEVLDDRTRRVEWAHDGEFYWSEHSRDVAAIVNAGGKVTAGSHGEMQGISFHWEMWNLGTGGMSPLEVLRAATLSGAEGIGFGNDLGSITVGKLADMLVLDADPLDDLRNTTSLRYVIKGGRLYDADTLDEQWPRKRPLGPLYWHEDQPSRSQ